MNDKFFNYNRIAKKMWWDKVKEAQDDCGIKFDSENNEAYSQRKIDIDTPEDEWVIESTGKKVNDKMRCYVELRGAGGDWEWPVYFFQCQVYDGGGRSFSTDDCFVIIPPMGRGNGHLIPNDKHGTWSSPDSNKNDVKLEDESVLWKELPELLRDYKDEVFEEKKAKYPDEFSEKTSSKTNKRRDQLKELKFATPEEALQHLSDMTGTTVKIAADQASSSEIDEFTNSYITTMLWSTTDNSNDQGGDPLDDNYDSSDISPELMKDIKKDCSEFIKDNYQFIQDAMSRAGHDFWLTRVGHGAGFWDGDWEDEIEGKNSGKHLTEVSEKFGGSDIYIGDDGKLYAM